MLGGPSFDVGKLRRMQGGVMASTNAVPTSLQENGRGDVCFSFIILQNPHIHIKKNFKLVNFPQWISFRTVFLSRQAFDQIDCAFATHTAIKSAWLRNCFQPTGSE